MSPSNSKIPTLQLDADAGRVFRSPLKHNPSEIIEVSRDIQTIRIPDGAFIVIPLGSKVRITQALGSAYTVEHGGNLYRVDGEDGDALGRPKRSGLPDDLQNAEVSVATIHSILKTCFDPEIPVNLMDLGLIYRVDVIVLPSDTPRKRIEIDMTLTAPGCGMGDVLVQDIKQKLKRLPQVDEVVVNLIFDPPWARHMISTAGQLALGLL
jgi:probable FeS assembly SUF system protein SufT